jgi:4-alpha-glucanotransferase
MVRALAEVSKERRAIIIGEDLGVVPPGFRDTMRQTEIQGYRVFFFEKEGERFIPAAHYPREALACVTTHDLHTLEGWWKGHDIEVRRAIGMIAEDDLETHRLSRDHERRHVLGFLEAEGLLPVELSPVMRSEIAPAETMPDAFAAALYRAVARTPSRLIVVPAEDLAGAVEQVNVPGTMDEHPNWRHRLPLTLDELVASPRFTSIVGALRAERPK